MYLFEKFILFYNEIIILIIMKNYDNCRQLHLIPVILNLALKFTPLENLQCM